MVAAAGELSAGELSDAAAHLCSTASRHADGAERLATAFRRVPVPLTSRYYLYRVWDWCVMAQEIRLPSASLLSGESRCIYRCVKIVGFWVYGVKS